MGFFLRGIANSSQNNWHYQQVKAMSHGRESEYEIRVRSLDWSDERPPQKVRPDYYGKYNLPPDQTGITDCKQPADEPNRGYESR